MRHEDRKINHLGQRVTVKWFSLPKPARYGLVYTGLGLLVYAANKAIWF
ncbi:hypothetical protein [Lentibacillus salinarum]|uniref:Uncharacterized protein n=1 Tax=Lentibacillus salinarum TaxID=446820 RepID=A0ABW3ZSH8_9BACI